MQDGLRQVLVRAGCDPAFAAAVIAAPETALRPFNLTQEERAALPARDGRLRALMGLPVSAPPGQSRAPAPGTGPTSSGAGDAAPGRRRAADAERGPDAQKPAAQREHTVSGAGEGPAGSPAVHLRLHVAFSLAKGQDDAAALHFVPLLSMPEPDADPAVLPVAALGPEHLPGQSAGHTVLDIRLHPTVVEGPAGTPEVIAPYAVATPPPRGTPAPGDTRPGPRPSEPQRPIGPRDAPGQPTDHRLAALAADLRSGKGGADAVLALIDAVAARHNA